MEKEAVPLRLREIVSLCEIGDARVWLPYCREDLVVLKLLCVPEGKGYWRRLAAEGSDDCHLHGVVEYMRSIPSKLTGATQTFKNHLDSGVFANLVQGCRLGHVLSLFML